MSTTYTKSISADFPAGKVNVDRLRYDIEQKATITVALDYEIGISVSGDSVEIPFKADLSTGEQTALEEVCTAHTGEPLPEDTVQTVKFDSASIPLTDDGRLRVGTEKSTNLKASFYSHDWCDRTTWYEAAVRVEDEEATDSGDHTTYSLSHEDVIDCYHGKLTQEDLLTDADGNSYRVVVKVDGSEKTEQDPHDGTGGDYTVDYANGGITFLTPLTEDETVEVTYHYATTALFTIKPEPGKQILLEMVEVQLSDDVEIKDTLRFNSYGYVDVFAPHLVDNPYPPGTLIPLGEPIVFKTMRDYFNDAQRAYPSYPPIGGSSWRGLPRTSYILDWDYLRGTLLMSSAGMEIQVVLDHNVEFGGAFATATFYCSQEPE
jgi:hypothetical protein